MILSEVAASTAGHSNPRVKGLSRIGFMTSFLLRSRSLSDPEAPACLRDMVANVEMIIAHH